MGFLTGSVLLGYGEHALKRGDLKPVSVEADVLVTRPSLRVTLLWHKVMFLNNDETLNNTTKKQKPSISVLRRLAIAQAAYLGVLSFTS